MELRVLRYFLSLADEGTISGAAEASHVTQPSLSRQLAALEREVGRSLFERGSRGITLTEEGIYLRRKAREIIDEVDGIVGTLSSYGDSISGKVRLGGGEGDHIRLIARVVGRMRRNNPLVRFEYRSGNADDAKRRLEDGTIDFGTFIDPVDLDAYEYLRLPGMLRWGVLARRDSELAALDKVRPSDLVGVPLMCSEQMLEGKWFSSWLGFDVKRLDIVMTYNLVTVPAMLAEEGVGYAFSFEGLVRVGPDNNLCFRPLEPSLESAMYLAWDPARSQSAACAQFLAQLRREIDFGE